jgi:uncharacterized membrane protein
MQNLIFLYLTRKKKTKETHIHVSEQKLYEKITSSDVIVEFILRQMFFFFYKHC